MNFQQVSFELSAGKASQLPPSQLPEIVFSGKSNVGKSSLLNKLVNRKALARVSATPGKTATINFFRLPDCRLVDLPGYGYAKVGREERRRWDELINSYFAKAERSTLLVQLLDSRHAPSADDKTMLEYLHHYQIPFIAVLTKADKLKKSQFEATVKEFETICAPYGCKGVYLTSSDNGYGMDALREVLDCAAQADEEQVQ